MTDTADALLEQLAAAEAERDMYRDKAHRAIQSLGTYDEKLGALVRRVQDLHARAERRANMSVGISELCWALGEDDPHDSTGSGVVQRD